MRRTAERARRRKLDPPHAPRIHGRCSSGSLRRLWLGLTLATGLVPACASRVDFTPNELERVQARAGVDPLRVYVSDKLIARYATEVRAQGFEVRSSIREASRQDFRTVETTRKTQGLILQVDELNGQPLLWVTFDPRCRTPECAYGFVRTEDQRFRLVTIPELNGYGSPTAFRGSTCKKNRLGKGKLASLAEANEVFVLKRPNGKLLTIELQVIKKIDKAGRTTRERQRGVDYVE